jgi:hypothetical protein
VGLASEDLPCCASTAYRSALHDVVEAETSQDRARACGRLICGSTSLPFPYLANEAVGRYSDEAVELIIWIDFVCPFTAPHSPGQVAFSPTSVI